MTLYVSTTHDQRGGSFAEGRIDMYKRENHIHLSRSVAEVMPLHTEEEDISTSVRIVERVDR